MLTKTVTRFPNHWHLACPCGWTAITPAAGLDDTLAREHCPGSPLTATFPVERGPGGMAGKGRP